MTENEKKLLDQVLSEAAYRGQLGGKAQDLIRAVQLERVSEISKETFLRAAIRYKQAQNEFYALNKQLQLPDFIKTELFDRAEKAIEPPTTPAPEAMTPEKLKAYTGRDFDR